MSQRAQTWRVLGVEGERGVEGLESERDAEVVLGAIGRLWDFSGHVAPVPAGFVVLVEWHGIDDAAMWGRLLGVVEIVRRFGAAASRAFFESPEEGAVDALVATE